MVFRCRKSRTTFGSTTTWKSRGWLFWTGKESTPFFLNEFHGEVKPTITGRVHVDEKFIHVGKKHGYDLNAIDSKTKYVLAHSYVVKRTFSACVKFLRQVKTTCYPQLLEAYERERRKPVDKRKLIIFVSDGFGNYRNAFNKLFYQTCKLRFGVPIACRKHWLEYNNNAIERYNGDIEDRTKTMRDFGSHEGAGRFLDLKRVVHNFVNPHMGLKGRTPAEAAAVDLKLGRRKLFNLIRFYAKKTHHSLRWQYLLVGVIRQFGPKNT